MAIFVEDTLRIGRVGIPLAVASEISVGTSSVEFELQRLEAASIAFEFSASIDTSDPGAGNLAINNANKDNATILTFNTQSSSDNARFDELLENLATNDRIFLQEIDTINVSIMYRITGAPTVIGTQVNIPITRERDQGAEFTVGNPLNATFFFTGGGSGGGTTLPAAQTRFLDNTVETDLSTTTVTNIAPSVGDVLIWRRAALVEQATISDPDIGLAIDEANRQGTDGMGNDVFDRASGTSVYDDDLANAYIYIGITTADFNNLVLGETFLEVRRNGELAFSSSLADLTTPVVTIGQFIYRRTTNNQLHYLAGDTMEVVTRSTSVTGQRYTYATPEGDFTANIDDLPFTAVDQDFTARVSGSSDNPSISANDRVKLTGLLTTTSSLTGQALTVLYKDGDPTGNPADYTETWNAANPVLPNFGSTRIVSILVNNNVTVTSVSGGATLGEQLNWIPERRIYRVVLPAEIATGTPTSHLPTGTIETFQPSGFNDGYKIVRANVVDSLLATIDAHSTGADIATLESKINALFPLTPNVVILNDWASIYNPSVISQEVVESTGYDSFIHYKSDSDRYESTGITYGTGAGVITYTGLTENLHRFFGFSIPQVSTVTLTGTSGTANIPIDGVNYLATFNTNLSTTASDFVTTHATALNTAGVTVTSNAAVLTFTGGVPSVLFTIGNGINVTGNLGGTSAAGSFGNQTLLWIVDGGTNIPFLDVAGGNFRINRYQISESAGQDVSNQFQFLTRTSGSEIVTTAGGSFSRYTIPNFPSGATNRSRTLQVEIDVILNGTTNTQAGHIQDVTLPELNIAQTLQTFDASIYLGPLYGNRTVNVTIGYEFTVPATELVVDLSLETAPGDVSVTFTNVAAIFNYTAAGVQTRTDNFTNFSDAGGVYTVSGPHELVVSFDPIIPQSGDSSGAIEAIGAALNRTTNAVASFNNINLSQPVPLWTDIEVPNTVEFKSFAADHYLRHSEIATFIRNAATRWAYGFARLREVTGHEVTEAIDLAAGSTLGGAPIVGTGRSNQDSQSFTAAATVTANLPASTTLADFVLMNVTWHTGVGTANDNDNRDYTDIIYVPSLIAHTRNEMLSPCRGRGAENFGIQIDTSTIAGTDTSIGLSIINLNDTAGALLPAGSLITAVRFF